MVASARDTELAVGPPIGMLCELTHRCPLQCPYCSNPVELDRPARELSTQEWCGVLEQAGRLGVLQVHLSGGEPAVRRDLEQIVAAAADAGIYSNLITAGVNVTRDRLHALLDAGLDHVQLSMQAAEPVVGDRVGGMRGGHERKLAFAEHVREAGAPLTVNAVLHRQNLDQLPAMIELAEAMGAGRLEAAHVQYYGWAYRNRAALMPTRAQLETATATVEAARARLKGIMQIDYVVPDYYARRPKPCMGGWGRQVLNVTPVGEVLPCHAAQTIPELEFDNVREKALADIWYRGQAFERFRGTDWMPEPCRSCARKEKDWGGCRCQALALTGDARSTDPACELSPSHHLMRETATAEAAAGSDAFAPRRFAGRPAADGAAH